MTTTTFPRPVSGDCADYYFKYINLIPEVDIMTYLHTQRDWFGDLIESLTPEQAHFRYARGKWSMAEMIGHVLDTERVFAYRMMVISRGDQNLFPGFEQDDYANGSIYDTIAPDELAQEWKAIRSSTIYLGRHMNAEMASRVGTASNLKLKASAVPYVIGGHVTYHYNFARQHYLVG